MLTVTSVITYCSKFDEYHFVWGIGWHSVLAECQFTTISTTITAISTSTPSTITTRISFMLLETNQFAMGDHHVTIVITSSAFFTTMTLWDAYMCWIATTTTTTTATPMAPGCIKRTRYWDEKESPVQIAMKRRKAQVLQYKQKMQ